MIAKIIGEDVQNCSDYQSLFNCLLATALKRMFPGKDVFVTNTAAEVGDDYYKLSPIGKNKLLDTYDKFKPDGVFVNQEDFRPVNVLLVPVK